MTFSDPDIPASPPISPLIQIRTPKTTVIGLNQGDTEKAHTLSSGKGAEQDGSKNRSESSELVQKDSDCTVSSVDEGLCIHIGDVWADVDSEPSRREGNGAIIRHGEEISSDIEEKEGKDIHKESDISRL